MLREMMELLLAEEMQEDEGCLDTMERLLGELRDRRVRMADLDVED